MRHAAALPNGSAVCATILTYPFTLQGAALPADETPNVLARVSDYVAPVTSASFVAREDTLAEAEPLLARFVAAMLAAKTFLNDPRNADCPTAAIARQLGIGAELAAQEYASVTNAGSGEVSPGGDFTVKQEGALNDVDVRREFGGIAGLPGDFDFVAALEPGTGRLIDSSVRDAAVRLLEENRAAFMANCSASA